MALGVLDRARLKKDRKALNERMDGLIATANTDLVTVGVELLGKKAVLEKNPPTDPEKLQKLKKDIDILEKMRVDINQRIDKLKSLAPKLSIAADKFAQDLQAVYATDGKDTEARSNYDKSYNALIDCLVEAQAFGDGNVAFWSKLHQNTAQEIATERKRTTLEGSTAGQLFDQLSWGTTWSIDPDAPMKQFWIRMSKEIAETTLTKIHEKEGVDPSEDRTVDLYVLAQVVDTSAFYTDEWPKVEKAIQNNILEALNVYVYTVKEVTDTNRYLLETLPSEEELRGKYDNSYIFTKNPQSLVYIKDGKIEQLTLHDKAKFEELLKKVNVSDEPIPRGKIISEKPFKREFNLESKQFQQLIAENLGHARGIYIQKPKEVVKVKTTEELDVYKKKVDDNFTKTQQKWQDHSKNKGKWLKFWAQMRNPKYKSQLTGLLAEARNENKSVEAPPSAEPVAEVQKTSINPPNTAKETTSATQQEVTEVNTTISIETARTTPDAEVIVPETIQTSKTAISAEASVLTTAEASRPTAAEANAPTVTEASAPKPQTMAEAEQAARKEISQLAFKTEIKQENEIRDVYKKYNLPAPDKQVFNDALTNYGVASLAKQIRNPALKEVLQTEAKPEILQDKSQFNRVWVDEANHVTQKANECNSDGNISESAKKGLLTNLSSRLSNLLTKVGVDDPKPEQVNQILKTSDQIAAKAEMPKQKAEAEAVSTPRLG